MWVGGVLTILLQLTSNYHLLEASRIPHISDFIREAGNEIPKSPCGQDRPKRQGELVIS